VDRGAPGGAGVGHEDGALLEGDVDEAAAGAGGLQRAHAAAEEVVHVRIPGSHSARIE